MSEGKDRLFDAIFRNDDLLVIAVDTGGRIVLFNPACERVSGFAREEVLGKRFWDFFIPEEYKPGLMGLLEDVRSGKSIPPFEYFMHTKDGKKRLTSLNVSVIAGKGGKPEMALALGLDITERRGAEEGLSRSEEHFRLLIENALDLISILEADGTIRYVGPSIERILGYPPAEMIGKSIFDYVHPEDIEGGEAALEFAKERSGVTKYMELRVRHKDGSWRIHEASSYNLLDDPAVGGMIINSRDITERKKAEEALRESRRTLSTLMGNLPGMAYRCRNDQDWTMEFVSDGCLELTGYGPADLTYNARVSYGQLIHPKDRERVWKEVREALAKKEPFELIYRIGTAAGEEKWVWEQGRGVFSLPGEFLALEGFITDITDRMRAERLVRVQRDLALKLSGTFDLHDTLRTAFEAILEATGFDGGVIYLFDEETGALDLVFHQGLSESFVAKVGHYEADTPNASLVEKGTPVYTEYKGLGIPLRDVELSEGIKALAVVPIKLEGKVIGCVNVASHSFEEVPARSRDVMEILAGLIGQAIARSRLVSALRESEKRYRLLHDFAGLAIFSYDRDLKMVSVNRQACEKIGYSEEELIGRNVLELGILHPGDFEKAIRGIEALLSGERTYKEELRLIRRDGSVLTVEMTGAALYGEGGEVVAISDIINDVTDKKRAEEALRESEERYRTTFEATGTAMFLVDRDATVSDANREMEKVFGYSRGEVLGRMRYMELLMPEDVEKVKSFSLKLLKGEIEGPIQYEIKARHKTGKPIDALISINMLPGMDRSVVSLIDITDKKTYERQLEERAEQLRDFLDIAAHELRHPATLLKGYAMTLGRRVETMDEETWSEALRAIETGADRLVYVVEELLDVSRIERSRFHVAREEAEVEPLVRRAVEEMLARRCDNEIKVDFKGATGTAYIDSERLVRLLIILLDNAVRYSPSGSRIEVTGKRSDDELVISVMDRGVGIPGEDRERIFDRFYQVESVLHHTGPGLGMGLYIGKRIVDAHGGRFWYEPRKKGGSIFRFTIPLRERP